MTVMNFFQNLYWCPSPLGLLQIEYNFFSIDSLDVTSRKYMFNIFLLLNTAKMKKINWLNSQLLKIWMVELSAWKSWLEESRLAKISDWRWTFFWPLTFDLWQAHKLFYFFSYDPPYSRGNNAHSMYQCVVVLRWSLLFWPTLATSFYL